MIRAPLVSFICVSLSAAACGDTHEKGASEYFYPCEDVTDGRPFASDENYRAFINAEAARTLVVNEQRALKIGVLPEKRTISALIPPTFTLTIPRVAALQGGVEQPGPSRAGVGRVCRVRKPGLWARISSALDPIGTAHAHCPAFTGENYFVRIANVRTPTSYAYEAVLAVDGFVPDVDIWRKAMNSRAGQELEITLMRATFSAGTITEGPFVSAAKQQFLVVP